MPKSFRALGRERVFPLLAGAFLLSVLQACALLAKPPSVEIVGVEVLELGLRSGRVEVTLDVENDQSRLMEIRGFLYEIQVRGPEDDAEWTILAEGFHTHALEIPGNETRRVAVPVPFQYDALENAVRSLLAQGEIPYRMRGEVWLGGSGLGLQVPFRSSGTLRP